MVNCIRITKGSPRSSKPMGFTKRLETKRPDMRSKKIEKVHIAIIGGGAARMIVVVTMKKEN